MNRVLQFIAENLHRELTVDELATVACSSKHHFQRQFSAYTGISVLRLVRLMRLKHASYQLAFNPAYRVVDVALDAGFSSQEAFSRAFKSTYGQSPTEFRNHPQWPNWLEQHQGTPQPMSPSLQVRIVNFETTLVAALEHRGSPQSLNASVAQFIQWRKSTGLSPQATSKTFGVPYGDPTKGEPEAWRFDICASVTETVPENLQGVLTKTIPGGRCAVAEHHGSTDLISTTVHQMYSSWLPSSGEQLRDCPCFFEYVKRMPTVTEAEQRTWVYLPLAG